MKNYAWKNTKTEDLWSILSEESGVQVNALMHTWTKKKGYPVISVKYKDCNLEFEQVFLIFCCYYFLLSDQESNGNCSLSIV